MTGHREPDDARVEVLDVTKIQPLPETAVLREKLLSEKARRRRQMDRGREILAYAVAAILAFVVVIAGVGYLQGDDLNAFLPVLATVGTLTGGVLAFYFATPDRPSG